MALPGAPAEQPPWLAGAVEELVSEIGQAAKAHEPTRDAFGRRLAALEAALSGIIKLLTGDDDLPRLLRRPAGAQKVHLAHTDLFVADELAHGTDVPPRYVSWRTLLAAESDDDVRRQAQVLARVGESLAESLDTDRLLADLRRAQVNLMTHAEIRSGSGRDRTGGAHSQPTAAEMSTAAAGTLAARLTGRRPDQLSNLLRALCGALWAAAMSRTKPPDWRHTFAVVWGKPIPGWALDVMAGKGKGRRRSTVSNPSGDELQATAILDALTQLKDQPQIARLQAANHDLLAELERRNPALYIQIARAIADANDRVGFIDSRFYAVISARITASQTVDAARNRHCEENRES